MPRPRPVAHQVDITELIEPKAVLGGGDGWKIVSLEAFVAEPHSLSQPTADPAVHQALMPCRLGGREMAGSGPPHYQAREPHPTGVERATGESAFLTGPKWQRVRAGRAAPLPINEPSTCLSLATRGSSGDSSFSLGTLGPCLTLEEWGTDAWACVLSTMATSQILTLEVGEGTKPFPRPRRANLVAFQSLLQK